MNLLFVHDHPFYMENEVIYSGGGLPSNIWLNYLLNFENIFVLGRRSYNTKDKKVISSHENVNFYLTQNYTSVKDLIFNISKIKQEISALIEKVDLVLIRLPSVLGFIAGEIALKKNKKIWIEQVGNANEALSNQGSLLGKLIAPIFELENKRLVKLANFISYVTENKLQKDYPSKSNAITTGLSDVVIKKILKTNDLERTRFFSDKIKIGLIGGFDAKYKGQDVLINAIHILDIEVKNNIELFFIGKGESIWLLNMVKDLKLTENVKFVGQLKSGDEVNNFLKTLSLYIQPSLTEGMPRSIIEAMSMGCPVIGSNVGGIPDVVNKKYIHHKGDYKELSIHIKELFFDREKLYEESKMSLIKAEPYLYENLYNKRVQFYSKMNQIKNEKFYFFN